MLDTDWMWASETILFFLFFSIPSLREGREKERNMCARNGK
jgi:hypothetical protein